MQYTDEERAIFRYHDGTNEVSADPQVIYRELHRALKGARMGGEGGLIDTIQRADDVLAFEAAEKLFPAVRAAFNLLPLMPDGTGCTEAMQFRTLLAFLGFLDGLKKKRAS